VRSTAVIAVKERQWWEIVCVFEGFADGQVTVDLGDGVGIDSGSFSAESAWLTRTLRHGLLCSFGGFPFRGEVLLEREDGVGDDERSRVDVEGGSVWGSGLINKVSGLCGGCQVNILPSVMGLERSRIWNALVNRSACCA